MNLNETIRFYRRQKNMTQEEVAEALGVSTPAVNKWENGSSCPDITLLSPLARLLNISLDTLLNHTDFLSEDEIKQLVQTTKLHLSTKSFEDAWKEILKTAHTYPNCEALILQIALLTERHFIYQSQALPDEIKTQLHKWYSQLAKSEDESIRTSASQCLFHFALSTENYALARQTLSAFPAQSTQRKQNQALLEEREGNTDEAQKVYEELLFQEYQVISASFAALQRLALQQNNFQHAQFLMQKQNQLAHLFEMGKYHELACQLDLANAQNDTETTKQLLTQMMDNAESITAFVHSPLYQHMTFKNISPEYFQDLKNSLQECLLENAGFDNSLSNSENS